MDGLEQNNITLPSKISRRLSYFLLIKALNFKTFIVMVPGCVEGRHTRPTDKGKKKKKKQGKQLTSDIRQGVYQ